MIRYDWNVPGSKQGLVVFVIRFCNFAMVVYDQDFLLE